MQKRGGAGPDSSDWRSFLARTFGLHGEEGEWTKDNGSPCEFDGNWSRDWLNGQRELLVRHSILPLRRDDGVLHMAVADPNDAGLARRLASTQIGRALIDLATRPAIDAARAESIPEED